MQVRKLLNEDDAVSPVIGVILMVAITVILAAVIASFVLGLGNTQSTTPTASFSFDYEQGNNGEVSNLTITHDGGDNVKETELFIRGSGFNDTRPSPVASGNWPAAVDHTEAGEWAGDTSSSIGDTSAVTAGDRVIVHVTSDYEMRVVWQAQEGDNSATLGSDTGPDS